MGESKRFWAAFSVLVLACALAGVMATYKTVSAGPAIPGANVKILLAAGHGSGVSIGHGSILTAAHVVDGVTTVDLQLEDGTKAKADVLWSSKEYDIAHLRLQGDTVMQSVDLACRMPENDEEVIAFGNPVKFENLSFRGYINGKGGTMGPWKYAFPADLTVIPGMSGGALYDSRGKVIGINVGTGIVPLGFMASWARIGIIVPGKTICDLMGREA